MESQRNAFQFLILTLSITTCAWATEFCAQHTFAPGGVCPPDFYDLSEEFGVDVCIYHSVLQMDWFNAQDLCRSLGAELINIFEPDEMHAVVYFMQCPPFRRDYHRAAVSLSYKHWLGGNNEDGSWKWYTEDGALPMSAFRTFWDYGEPDGTSVCGVFSAGKQTFTEGSYQKWETSHCYTERPIVCTLRY